MESSIRSTFYNLSGLVFVEIEENGVEPAVQFESPLFGVLFHSADDPRRGHFGAFPKRIVGGQVAVLPEQRVEVRQIGHRLDIMVMARRGVRRFTPKMLGPTNAVVMGLMAVAIHCGASSGRIGMDTLCVGFLHFIVMRGGAG